MTTRHTCTRTETATQWIAWHFAELLAVAAPLVLGWLVAGWLALGSIGVGVAWGVHELHTRRTRTALPAGAAPRQITSTTTENAPAPADRDENRERA
ncbi:hypothetical protein ACWEOE_34090 [Amycolatopsis sp. NPDC004368]